MAKATMKLKVVRSARSATGNEPPRSLDNHGRSLWNRIVNEYDVSDAGGRELLLLACQALDRAEALRAQIDAEGEVQKVKGVLRDHPALKHELQNRSFVAKALDRMGLNLEVPVRSVGRPPIGGYGVTAEDLAAMREHDE
jgi:hypothetical protein